jgi:hypothetical protein
MQNNDAQKQCKKRNKDETIESRSLSTSFSRNEILTVGGGGGGEAIRQMVYNKGQTKKITPRHYLIKKKHIVYV